ncbi:heavy-metal-associated domain-containing protein, partial [Listeria monocytogenes]|nr:heavy-metal-associated domain-containing protein [Listeria monocytogenes]
MFENLRGVYTMSDKYVRQDLNVFGMTCAACSTRIEKSLNKADGV